MSRFLISLLLLSVFDPLIDSTAVEFDQQLIDISNDIQHGNLSPSHSSEDFQRFVNICQKLDALQDAPANHLYEDLYNLASGNEQTKTTLQQQNLMRWMVQLLHRYSRTSQRHFALLNFVAALIKNAPVDWVRFCLDRNSELSELLFDERFMVRRLLSARTSVQLMFLLGPKDIKDGFVLKTGKDDSAKFVMHSLIDAIVCSKQNDLDYHKELFRLFFAQWVEYHKTESSDKICSDPDRVLCHYVKSLMLNKLWHEIAIPITPDHNDDIIEMLRVIARSIVGIKTNTDPAKHDRDLIKHLLKMANDELKKNPERVRLNAEFQDKVKAKLRSGNIPSLSDIAETSHLSKLGPDFHEGYVHLAAQLTMASLSIPEQSLSHSLNAIKSGFEMNGLKFRLLGSSSKSGIRSADKILHSGQVGMNCLAALALILDPVWAQDESESKTRFVLALVRLAPPAAQAIMYWATPRQKVTTWFSKDLIQDSLELSRDSDKQQRCQQGHEVNIDNHSSIDCPDCEQVIDQIRHRIVNGFVDELRLFPSLDRLS